MLAIPNLHSSLDGFLTSCNESRGLPLLSFTFQFRWISNRLSIPHQVYSQVHLHSSLDGFLTQHGKIFQLFCQDLHSSLDGFLTTLTRNAPMTIVIFTFQFRWISNSANTPLFDSNQPDLHSSLDGFLTNTITSTISGALKFTFQFRWISN